MASVNRRGFLAALMLISGVSARRRMTAQQRGLDRFVIPSPPCTEADLTPAVEAGPEFTANSPARTSLVDAGTTGTKIVLTGSVIGLKCGRVKGARIDFWQADTRGAYDMQGSRLRGHQFTDADGRYRLATIMPGSSGNRAPHINARVTPPEQAALTTRLFLPDDPRNARDPSFKPKLLLKPGPDAPGKSFTFDFILNL